MLTFNSIINFASGVVNGSHATNTANLTKCQTLLNTKWGDNANLIANYT